MWYHTNTNAPERVNIFFRVFFWKKKKVRIVKNAKINFIKEPLLFFFSFFYVVDFFYFLRCPSIFPQEISMGCVMFPPRYLMHHVSLKEYFFFEIILLERDKSDWF